MKWQQGLAVITRAEHWEQAAQHLWGLSRADLATYQLLAPSEALHPIDNFRKIIPLETQQTRAVRARAATR